ncbi:DUF4174 domain-containing protein [Echinicola sp. CAU 1574]|uniref:DUF4174 domain-containing protein n=1 Tax=Echinicola arenosa TaxID=2774144 RepID=A0ABR9AMP2_9BACT|nr:DUF4174 domain-containing protein [Echinicola arenosa]MBD8489970.1 DUF4174 domain-containing protein [Echinicola arenosa]
MKHLHLLILWFVFNLSNNLHAQEMSEHRWKDRLLIIKTIELSDSIYKKQINALQKNLGELKERKLVVYQFHKDKFKTGLDSKKAWKHTENKEWVEALKLTNNEFEIILIGLDGQIKRRQSQFLAPNELFGTIDAMPMRRQEMESERHN